VYAIALVGKALIVEVETMTMITMAAMTAILPHVARNRALTRRESIMYRAAREGCGVNDSGGECSREKIRSACERHVGKTGTILWMRLPVCRAARNESSARTARFPTTRGSSLARASKFGIPDNPCDLSRSYELCNDFSAAVAAAAAAAAAMVTLNMAAFYQRAGHVALSLRDVEMVVHCSRS